MVEEAQSTERSALAAGRIRNPDQPKSVNTSASEDVGILRRMLIQSSRRPRGLA